MVRVSLLKTVSYRKKFYLLPVFIRLCVNINLPQQQYLPLYAADMARGIDGRLWVISDRTQAPSGSGYALENKYAMSSVLPELFSNLNVEDCLLILIRFNRR